MHSPSWLSILFLLLLRHPSRWSVPSSRAFYNAVDTHDHSKELDDDEKAEEEEKEEEERRVRDFSSSFRTGEILPSATGSLRMAPILRLQEIQGRREGKKER